MSTNNPGQVVLKYFRGGGWGYVEVPEAGLKAKIQELIATGAVADTMEAFKSATLDVSYVLVVKLDDVVV